MIKAVKLTLKDSKIISKSKGSKLKINFIEFNRMSKIFINNFYYNMFVAFLII
tara:strand:- start:859 stop:1017 length:159 start_codon:yes stop_codon:yes gene_type:complete